MRSVLYGMLSCVLFFAVRVTSTSYPRNEFAANACPKCFAKFQDLPYGTVLDVLIFSCHNRSAWTTCR